MIESAGYVWSVLFFYCRWLIVRRFCFIHQFVRGGKVAMSVALRPSGPSIINKLVIVDISPLKGRISDDFQSYLEGMKQINLKKIKTRKEADEILAKFEKVITFLIHCPFDAMVCYNFRSF